jgi:transcriptional regulator with XRE-family HTH domain
MGTEFGRFLKEKRQQKEITVRHLADLVGVSAGYYCDIESGRRNPPDREILDKMIASLCLVGEDITIFYDLAGQARSEAPTDLSGYINQYEEVRVALRMAKDSGNPGVWNKFINYMELEKGDKRDD